ncbi:MULTISPECIES: hypothetical protein [Brenneria]|uniref:Uncharacterized protein n=1 Tax=Brenneria nigrifluens DSM 30175 = ATCC 13028 TaxID=1121120 RepID=A0A2U1UWD3_9GAMM|nr:MULTISPECIES: hypothetical protein [Brenneria]EHD22651.1 hypothetical protein BrE312_3286 [Brenneria sp. EniD312]PWC25983.1 hypothetical protein DDT54_01260 [Brenneria nigrifluens DSM 30175 = ATCC 13028]QCR05633.1 hypothetical protein EH206_16460 [Brenneria nigrifluens DSM 30175 = ATCC 13028]
MEKSLTVYGWMIMTLFGGAYIGAIVAWTIYSIHNSDPLAWVLMIGGGVVAITIVAALIAWLIQPLIVVSGMIFGGVGSLLSYLIRRYRRSHA